MNEVDEQIERLLRCERGEAPAPWYITVFPTNRCNLRCGICWQRRFDHLHDDIPDERLVRLVDEAAALGGRDWCIAGGGEPMLRAEVVLKMCERICAQGMNGTMLTNGVAFKPEYFERLAECRWKNVAVSLDGHTEEINDAIRSKGSFARASENFRNIKELRDRKGYAQPNCSIHTTYTRLNCDKLDKMVELAHELGFSTVTTAALNDTGADCGGFKLTEEQRRRVPEYVARGKERAQELGITVFFDDLLLEGAVSCASVPRHDSTFRTAVCFEPWMSFVVHADGRVGPCCVFWEENAPSILEHSLEEIWLGPYFEGIRNRLRSRRLPKFCAKCVPAPPSIDGRTCVWRDRLVEEELQWQGLGSSKRAVFFLNKSLQSLRRYGLRNAWRRGKEFMRITTKK